MKPKTKKKIDGRNSSREVMEHQRLRALELRKKNWAVKDIAESFGVHRGSVSRWFTNVRRHGVEILHRKKAPGARPKLDNDEQTRLIMLLKHSAIEYGFETPLWDCTRVRWLIWNQFGKKMAISNVWSMLRRLGLTPQVPEKKALEQNKVLVESWIQREWPKIEEHARRWRALVYFEDEAGISLIPALGRTWAPRGQTPIVSVTGSKSGISVTSAISRSGRLLFRIEKEKVNGKLHAEFLNQILKHHPLRKIIVVEDRAPTHRSAVVEQFIAEHKRRFARYFLPPYSPELNPDEETWNYLKNKKLKTHQVQTKEQLRELVLSKMRGIQRRPRLVKSFFRKSNVT